MNLQEVHKRFPDGLPLLDPLEDLCIKDDRLKSLMGKTEAFERRMHKHPLHPSSQLKDIYALCEKKVEVREIAEKTGKPCTCIM